MGIRKISIKIISGFIFLSILLFISCQTDPKINNIFNTDYTKEEFKVKVKTSILNIEEENEYSAEILSYFNYYNINFPEIIHKYGFISFDEENISVHVFIPEEAIKTIFLIHGYLLHSIIYKELLKLILENKYALVAMDLPGHGLSSGKEGSISDFNEYTRVLKACIDFLKPVVPPLYGIIGHSTGGSIIIDYLLYNKSPFKKYILSAPLIHSDIYCLSQVGITLINWLIKEVHTYPRGNIGDKEKAEFVKNDPLNIKIIPLTWVKSLFKWNDKINKSNKMIEQRLLILQGNKDTALEWKYNLKMINKIAPNAEIKIIENAKHELFLDKKEIRRQAFDYIISFLAE